MGAVQPCRGVGFAAESLLKVLVVREVSGQDFDRDDPVGVGVMGPPHLAHAAATQQLDQAITPERRALHRLTIRSQPLTDGQTGYCPYSRSVIDLTAASPM